MSADITPRRRFGGGAAVAIAALTALSVFAVTSLAKDRPVGPDASPLFGVDIPSRYRQWALVGGSEEAEPLIELRGILGNSVAVQVFQSGTQRFPDGTILVKLAWKRVPSTVFQSASVPGRRPRFRSW